MNWRTRAERLRALPLPVVLARLAAVRDPYDPAKWHTARGLLSITGAKFMNWNSGFGGGGAIDLVIHLQQLGFGQALEWLEGHFGGLTLLQPESTPPAQTLTLPTPVPENWPRVERYLIAERNLPGALLQPLVQSATPLRRCLGQRRVPPARP